MDSSTFNNLISSLKQIGFDDDKADAIKTTIQSARKISATQMVQLLKFISFNDTKLEVAKAAYQYTTDPRDFGSVVGGAFSFSDAKEELNAHIRQNPHKSPVPPKVVIIHDCHRWN
jgi:hypothetical protein